MNKRIGLIRASVVALAFAVLGPAIAESQIFVICGVYRNSYADTDANLCHGTGSGCIECTFIVLKKDEGDVPMDPPLQEATLDSYTSGFDYTQEPSQPVSLALDTGLASTPQRLSACEGPSPYDRIRTARRERVPPLVNDRSRRGLWKQVSAR